ncbi:LXG domain-containing protein [Priestia flexa]|uniref:LXG domain-containing protein n=1 Tax=Priestia flexa TaxID=86664 RepID=UPI00240DEEA7|nr:T7SS effector LXG polymorphic toxin [Priestia flexa]WEZ08544.1 T7SS effector LXG polymorphic toxin [Priestia flexa]
MAKVLDVASLHKAIADSTKKLVAQQAAMNRIEMSVKQISKLQDSFDGKGGQAIQTFYQECHEPFLVFYQAAISRYASILSVMKSKVAEVESDKQGMIKQSFLEDDLTSGLEKAKQLTINLTDEANEIIKQVQSEISLTDFDDSKVLTKFNTASKSLNDIVEELQSFDSSQWAALDNVQADIETMKTYIGFVKGMISNGARTLNLYTEGAVKASTTWNEMTKRNAESIQLAQQYPSSFSQITVRSQYQQMYDLYYANSNIGGSTSYAQGPSVSASDSAVSGRAEKSNATFNFTEIDLEKKAEDQFGSDGLGNAEAKLSTTDGEFAVSGAASVVDTEHMDNVPSFVDQKLLFSEVQGAVPYELDSLKNSLQYGQLIGGKLNGTVSKSSFSHDRSPLSGDFIAGQAEAQANVENYTLNLGTELSAAKIETKIEPLNFFGYKPLKEWFGIEYNPYVGVDILLGSVALGGSVGAETGGKVALGVGVGGKFGFEKEDDEE